jgi:hypothetical protein
MTTAEPDDQAETRAQLDTALRAHARHQLGTDGEVIVSWIVLAATRRFDGGGVVITLPSDQAMPFWEARGILGDALAAIDRLANTPADDGD